MTHFLPTRSDNFFASTRSEGIFSGSGGLLSRESTNHDYSRLPTQDFSLEPSSRLPDRRHTIGTSQVPRQGQRTSTNDHELPRVDARQCRHTVHLGALGNEEESQQEVHEAQSIAARHAKTRHSVNENLTIEQPAFQSFIGFVIVLNSLLMGLEIDVPWYGWFWLEQALICVYVFELIMRLNLFGRFFFFCYNDDIVWNLLDFIIVGSSVLDLWITPLFALIMQSSSGVSRASGNEKEELSLGKFMMLMRMLRLMRILRLAKLVKSVRPLFILVTGVMAALQGVAWVLVLTIVTLYAMGILATALIGKKMVFPPDMDVPEEALHPFRTVPDSMFTLFRIMSGAASDSDIVAIDIVTADVPSIKLAFVFFMITTSWTLLSILTAVVSDNMISTTGQHEAEHKLANAEDERDNHVQRLKDVFHTISVRGDGQVEKDEIEAFLSNETNALLTAKSCHVPVRDVKEVLESVAEACKGTTVSLEDFVEHLADVSNIVTEKSIMKIEAKLSKLSRHQLETSKKLYNMMSSWQEPSNNGEKSPKAGDKSPKASPRAMRNKPEPSKAEKLMEEVAKRTEACLTEIEKNNERLVENLTSMTKALEHALPTFGVAQFSEVLEIQLRRMQHELIYNLKGQDSDITKVGQEATAIGAMTSISVSEQASPSTQNALIADGIAGPAQAIEREKTGLPEAIESIDEGQRVVSNEKPRDALLTESLLGHSGPPASGVEMKLSAAEIVARLVTTEESIRGLQQTTESMLRKNEGLVEKMSKTVDQGLSALALDKFSANVEHELRTMRQESLELLRIIRGQDPEISKVRDRLPKGTVPDISNATAPEANQASPSTSMHSAVEGITGSSSSFT